MRDDVERASRATVRRKVELFGDGSDSLYDIGSNRHLFGRLVRDLPVRRSSTARVLYDEEGLLAHVRRSSSFVPARITGLVEGDDIGPEVELAVAVNGRIAALTRCDGDHRFAALVPKTSFREGANRVELLAISGTPSAPRLLVLGKTGKS